MENLENMTREEKKVAIAKDVIAHLDLLKPAHGIYCEASELDKTVPTSGEAQPYIDRISKDCQVCALGACMLSYVRLFDSFDLNAMQRDLSSGWGYIPAFQIRSALEDVFTLGELDAVEHDFESNFDRYADYPHAGAVEHLRSTMQWIIDRKGNIPLNRFR